jgi:hypothetical protein
MRNSLLSLNEQGVEALEGLVLTMTDLPILKAEVVGDMTRIQEEDPRTMVLQAVTRFLKFLHLQDSLQDLVLRLASSIEEQQQVQVMEESSQTREVKEDRHSDRLLPCTLLLQVVLFTETMLTTP